MHIVLLGIGSNQCVLLLSALSVSLGGSRLRCLVGFGQEACHIEGAAQLQRRPGGVRDSIGPKRVYMHFPLYLLYSFVRDQESP